MTQIGHWTEVSYWWAATNILCWKYLDQNRTFFGIIRIHSNNCVGGLRSCLGPNPHGFRAPGSGRSENSIVFSTCGLDRNCFRNDFIDLVGWLGISWNRVDVSKVHLSVCFANSCLFRHHTFDSTEHRWIRCGPRETLQQSPATNGVVILRGIGGSIRGWFVTNDRTVVVSWSHTTIGSTWRDHWSCIDREQAAPGCVLSRNSCFPVIHGSRSVLVSRITNVYVWPIAAVKIAQIYPLRIAAYGPKIEV